MSFLKVSGWNSEYRSVDRVLRHYERRVKSEHTKTNLCQCLMAFCNFAGKDPDEVLRLSGKEASRLVQNFIDSLAKRGSSVRSVNVALAYLKTFYKVNGFKGARALEVERYHQPSRYRKRGEYIPTPEEIYRMAYAAGSMRNKALILALYTSGLRNSTLRALLYRDVKEELSKGLEVLLVPVYPEMKRVDPDACKGNIPYYSFLSRETVEAIREYLAERLKKYGGITDDEPLFASETTNLPLEVRRRTRVKELALARIVKRAARKVGLKDWRNVYPHCLRKAFESALRNNRLDPKDQEFLMGHILPGSQDAYYDKTKVEELRMKYAQVEFFPRVSISAEQLRKKQVIDMVKLLGFPEDTIKRVEEALAKYSTVDEAMDEIKKLKLESYRMRKKEMANDDSLNCESKKIIGEHDLEAYMAKGWDIQTILPSGRILIRKS
ncbi:MAG: site-specific integrase [Candidatus Bathyarchaeia archaeon]